MEQKGFVPLFPPPTTPSPRSILSPKTLQRLWKIQQWVYDKRGKRALSLTEILSHHLIGKEEESAQGAGESPCLPLQPPHNAWWWQPVNSHRNPGRLLEQAPASIHPVLLHPSLPRDPPRVPGGSAATATAWIPSLPRLLRQCRV